MKVIKTVSLFGLMAMTVGIVYAFIVGDFATEGNQILSMPWGIVSLVDLYVGFILFSAWIIYREKIWWHTVLWVFFMMTLGFWTACLYVFIAVQTSDGSWSHLLHGRHAKHMN
ncbi:MAG TPA: DUF1475 family protein [Longilinea sp.]|nr:DUF1475 family protein [Longilinea sp.]